MFYSCSTYFRLSWRGLFRNILSGALVPIHVALKKNCVHSMNARSRFAIARSESAVLPQNSRHRRKHSWHDRKTNGIAAKSAALPQNLVRYHLVDSRGNAAHFAAMLLILLICGDAMYLAALPLRSDVSLVPARHT